MARMVFEYLLITTAKKARNWSRIQRQLCYFIGGPFNKQIRIEGGVSKLSASDAEEYFQRRPRISQIAASISDQTKKIESRDKLIEKYNEMEESNKVNKVLERPDFWGGFKLIPKKFEFWQGQSSRLHDRLVFRLKSEQEVDGQLVKEAEDGWTLERLQP